MNATGRTLVFVGVAAVAAVAASGVRYANQPPAVEGFSDVGKQFYADFQDPLKATELSVLKYDADAKDPLSFVVKQNDQGLWVIPSHHNYPAEAAQRLAKTAASLIGISKIALQSRSKDDWGRYGVEDPSSEVAVDAVAKENEKDQTRGTRISLRDSSGNSLVDLIVGKPVEGRQKHFYVREPEKNPVFIAKFDADLSAKFSDWIEPDLLKLNQNDIVKVVVDQYSVDEEQGAVLQGETFEFSKDKTANKWAMAGLDPITESLKESAVTDVTSNLDQLKIVGVRPKPEGLNPDLTVTPEVAQNPLLKQLLRDDMQRQGFYIARGENDVVKLVSNEGELIAGTSNGVSYTLYFGEIARGTAKDIEVGLNEAKPAEGETKAEGTEEKPPEKPPETPTPDEKPDGPESGPRRYLLVKVEYDESLLGPPPAEPTAPEKPAILNEGAPPSEEKPAEAPKDEAPKDEAPKDEAPKDEAPKDEAPKEDEKPKEPAADAPTPDAPSEPKPETPVDPGACDEPAKAEVAAEEPAKESPSQDSPAAATTPPVQETPTPAPADEATPAKEDGAAPAKTDDPAAPQTDPNAPVATTPTPEPQQPPVDLKAEAQKAYDQAMGDYEAAKAGHQDALKSWEEKTKEGKKKVSELSTRFGSWYYVISADSFEKFKLSRAAVVEPKKESTPEESAIPGAGSIPNFDLPSPGK